MVTSSEDSGRPVPLILLTAIIGAVVLAALWKFWLGASSGGSSGKRRKVPRTRVLFMGPMGAGKTAAMFKLSQDVLARTVTSAKTCTLPLPGATGLVDAITTVPGHPSALRELEAELPAAGKIVVWIDAGAVGSQVPPAARQLYRVLTDASIVDADVPVLIVANKADLPTAITSTKLKQLLEKEMDLLKSARANDLASTDQGEQDAAGDDHALALGRAGLPFTFAEDSPVEVLFASASVVNGALEAVVDFMHA